MNKKKIMSLFMTVVMCLSLLGGISLNTRQVQADDGLVLHLKFDGNLTDSSGANNNAECNIGNISFEQGIFGQAAMFNGKSYIEIKDNDSLDLNNLTLSLWAYKSKNMESDKDVPYIYKGEDEESWASPYLLYELADNHPAIYLHDASSVGELDQFEMTGNSIDIHKWFLLTVTFDGSEARMYEDGVLVKKQQASGAPIATIGDLYIGMNDGEFFFHGLMDDVRIYNRSLSSSEVTSLYNEGMASNPGFLTQKDSLVAHYKFEGNYNDSSDLNNDAEVAAGTVKFVDGANGKGIKFEKGSYLEVESNDSIDFDEGFSATGWVRIDKNETNMTLLNRPKVSTTTISEDYAYRLLFRDDYMEYAYVPFGDQPGTDYKGYSFDNTLKGKWYHFGVTFNGKQIRFYRNGKMIGKEMIDGTDVKIAHAGGRLMIGSDGDNFFNGALDELKLYNYEISANDVLKDANSKDALTISGGNINAIKALKAKSSITLSPTRTYIQTGETKSLTSGVTYSSSNKKVFTVSKTGKITAVKKGKAKLTVTHGGLTATYTVNVK